MPALALILARAGSKGVPGKNAAIVGGRPCIAWTIEAAQEARSVSRVVVSTDGKDLQQIAMEMGADVVARPADLANDTATIDAAARHAVSAIHSPSLRQGAGGRAANVAERPLHQVPAQSQASIQPVVILYANVPIRPDGLIDRAVHLLLESSADSVQSYAPVGKHHPWWTARVDPATGQVRPWEGNVLNHGVFRRQDLPPAHIPDGGVLVVTRAALFLEHPEVPPGPHAFFGRPDRRRGIINPEGSVIDIDSPTDLLVADTLLNQQRDREVAAMLHPGSTRS